VIFYTLQGPSHCLEIHEDKILLQKRAWFRLFGKTQVKTWGIQDLAQFNITMPRYLLWGKVEWKSFDGQKGLFRFSTNPVMMKKIELYLQKKILKNHQKAIAVVEKSMAKQAPKKSKKGRKKDNQQAA
jgi:hypothetical protein